MSEFRIESQLVFVTVVVEDKAVETVLLIEGKAIDLQKFQLHCLND